MSSDSFADLGGGLRKVAEGLIRLIDLTSGRLRAHQRTRKLTGSRQLVTGARIQPVTWLRRY
jgi:hypothetical protein